MYVLSIVLCILLVYLIYCNYMVEQFLNIENHRGIHNYNKYPPCFNFDKSIINIYDFFENKKLLNKAYLLLNIYSMVLCQQKDVNIDNIHLRIDNLKKMGFDKITNNDYIKYQSIVNSIISPEKRLKLDTHSKIFLTATTYFIEKNLFKLKKYILPIDYTTLQDMNKDFYKLHYSKF